MPRTILDEVKRSMEIVKADTLLDDDVKEKFTRFLKPILLRLMFA